jgi:hypothetical protein
VTKDCLFAVNPMSMALLFAAASCSPSGGGAPDGSAPMGTVAHTLFCSEGETLVAVDVASGTARAGALADVVGPTDMQVTDSGHVVVNLTGKNQVLVASPSPLRELARVSSSSTGASRPVHGFLTPKIAGKQHWVANNDGEPGVAASNSMLLVDVTPGSATFLKAVGEIGLGIGHHKNAFSPGKARVSVSNIGDCDTVLQVIDYSTASAPRLVKRWSAAELDPMRDCSMSRPTPHGAAAAANGKGYHNLTGWGVILSVDQDQDSPTFKLLPTTGNGAGYTKAGKDGRHVYTLQRTPREGDAARPGADCQIGQLVVIDSQADAVVKQVPLLYTGPGCTSKLPATATRVGPDHLQLSNDGKTLFITSQGEPPAMTTETHYSDQQLVVDLSDPAAPVQKPSITVGKHSGHRSSRVSGDGKLLFVVNKNDSTISQIEIATSTVKTISLRGAPAQIATYGSAEGPSAQTGPH